MKNNTRKICLFLFFLFFMPAVASAASRYWVGGTGTWNATAGAKWATTSGGVGGANVPTASDDVFFDAASGAVTVSLGASVSCNKLNFSGFTGTFSHGNYTINAYGAIKFRSTMTYTLDATPTNSRIITNDDCGLTTEGKTLGRVTSSSGTLTFKDDMTAASMDVYANGSVDTAGYTCTWGSLSAGTGGNARTLDLGASSITINGSANNGDSWSVDVATNLTIDCGTSAITVAWTGSSNYFKGGGFTYNNVTFTGASIPIITGTNTFANLTRTGSAALTDEIQFADNQTISGTLTLNGNSVANRLYVKSDTMGTARTLTVGTAVAVSNADFVDITGAGAASWDISGATGGSGDCGGNSGITFTPATTLYWSADTGNWSDSSKWFLGSGGTGGAGRVPLAQDTARFDANSFTTTTRVVTLDCPRVGSVNWTGATNTPRWTYGNAFRIYGSVLLIGGMNLTVNKDMYFDNRSPVTINSAGKNYGTYLRINCFGSKVSLAANLNLNGFGFWMYAGEFDMSGYNLSVQKVTFSGSLDKTLTMNRGTLTVTSTGTIWDGSGTPFTINRGTSTIAISDTSATAKTFAGAGKTYNNLSITGTGSGAVIFTGSNTFNNISIGAPKTVKFTAGTTTTLEGTLLARGSSGNLVTLNSDTGAASFTLSKASGYVDCDWLYLDYSTVTGGATWYAGANSNDHSNNTGWTFTVPPFFTGGDGRGENYAEFADDLPAVSFNALFISGD